MERKLSEETLKEFLIIQQKEIDGAVIYQKLQTLTDDEEMKAPFRALQPMMGHAAILDGLTNQMLALRKTPEKNFYSLPRNFVLPNCGETFKR